MGEARPARSHLLVPGPSGWAHAYLEARRASRSMLVLFSSSSQQPVCVGPPETWPPGAAARLLSGEYSLQTDEALVHVTPAADAAFVCVYDGHGGGEAAQYCREALHVNACAAAAARL
ncbi:hypothetical protein EMIHUDRAFT_243987 [Emiliania huxleyi CCMP1516]|uniref:PPM-type phosphatase domain-containing protein n=2 Tax=Emiliania huxleyi TaxID=2903 RepID=A0A0D3J250_EMIH1|nr:hypothetical protein EMIHUDRAFT_243987 [Emiliania huxleyi CCMP1516]EOD17585.1 hypothetical protein EMIHUDRAFT_243987 [Emiliania huxleyi CCMP1516]|eukprot:XP_005770014.1 hypothetical protein EMIHUDRAFT_243987 [Emiliania huxleyi CCMP1516]